MIINQKLFKTGQVVETSHILGEKNTGEIKGATYKNGSWHYEILLNRKRDVEIVPEHLIDKVIKVSNNEI